jgi:hypothetical protein
VSQAQDAINYASAQIGKPYVFGTNGPDTFDCSGLTQAAYAHANPPVRLTHFTGTQVLEGVAVSKNSLIPGDLIFPDPGHVQLYIGGGRVIEAPHAGALVQERSMYGVWQARRVARDGLMATGTTGVSPEEKALTLAGFDLGDLARVGSATKIFDTLASLTFWKRGAYIILGGLFIFVGVTILAAYMIFRAGRAAAPTVASGASIAGGVFGSELLSRKLIDTEGGEVPVTSVPVSPVFTPPPPPKKRAPKSLYKPRHGARAVNPATGRAKDVVRGGDLGPPYIWGKPVDEVLKSGRRTNAFEETLKRAKGEK